ncbi:hypothetical protein ACJX0J_016507 [Zea mays]
MVLIYISTTFLLSRDIFRHLISFFLFRTEGITSDLGGALAYPFRVGPCFLYDRLYDPVSSMFVVSIALLVVYVESGHIMAVNFSLSDVFLWLMTENLTLLFLWIAPLMPYVIALLLTPLGWLLFNTLDTNKAINCFSCPFLHFFWSAKIMSLNLKALPVDLVHFTPLRGGRSEIVFAIK